MTYDLSKCHRCGWHLSDAHVAHLCWGGPGMPVMMGWPPGKNPQAQTTSAPSGEEE